MSFTYSQFIQTLDLDDVSPTAPLDGQVLVWSDASNLYIPGTISGGGSGGITSLNALTGLSQTLTASSDANITLSIVSTGTDHLFTMGFTGTLADARIAENGVTQHQAALSISESQISDLQNYSLTSHTHTYALADLSNVSGTGSTSNLFLATPSSSSGDFSARLISSADLPGHTHTATHINSGTFLNARISVGNVTQHESSLSILESQISNLQSYSLTSHTHTESDITDFGSYSTTGHTHTESDISDLGSYYSQGDTILAANGTVTAPSFSFANDTGTGMFLNVGLSEVSLVSDGVAVITVGAVGGPLRSVIIDAAIMVLNSDFSWNVVTNDAIFIATNTANPSKLSLREATNNGTSAVSFTAPTSLGSSVSFELPATDGNADDVLKTDGSNVLSFAPVAESPIGSVVAWFKSITGVPALPSGWVQCDGQTLSDADSPIDGEVIPDLNGNNDFLRGSSASGGTGGSATHTLTESEMPSHTHAVDTTTSSSGTGSLISVLVGKGSRSSSSTGGDVAHNNEPQYTNTVWIMRVK